jgi:glutathione S-transferase
MPDGHGSGARANGTFGGRPCGYRPGAGALERPPGPKRRAFLLGDWSIADAFFAPVATRFRTYAIEAGSPDLVDYMDRLLNWPDFLEWEAAGRLET